MTEGEIPPPPKKVKDEPEDKEELELMKKQNEELYTIRDQISGLGKNKLIAILEKNRQEVPIGESNVNIFMLYH